MRDPNRIDLFLKELGDLWKEVPDWRFGQLIENLRNVEGDLFHLEEDKFLIYLKKFIERYE